MRIKELVLHSSLTVRQKEILRSRSNFLLLTGPAGTAKTYTGLARGMKLLHSDLVDRIVVIRSAVPTRDIGFLPGSQQEKIDAYAAPYIDVINGMSPKRKYQQLIQDGVIQFEPTSYLRGRTFEDTYILIDEYQNMSAHELETAITRVGEGTHLILCGDSDQSDLIGREAADHKRVIRTLTFMEDFEVHEFTEDEIVRSDFVRRYYRAKREVASQEPSVSSRSPV
jgi:phosphate starvation-inducible PhoH-like protein